MAEGLGVPLANALLSAVLQAGPSLVWTQTWVQFHVGAPGAAGTGNPAGETRRVEATGKFGTDPASGSIVNDATIGPLTSVSTTEVWTHWSAWDSSTSGTFGFSGALSGGSVTAGDDAELAPGACTVTVPTAS